MYEYLISTLGTAFLARIYGRDYYEIVRHDTATLGLYCYGCLHATVDNMNQFTIMPNMHLETVSGRKAIVALMYKVANGVKINATQNKGRVVIQLGTDKFVVNPKQNIVLDLRSTVPIIMSEVIPQYNMLVDRKAKNKVMKPWAGVKAHIHLKFALKPELKNLNINWFTREKKLQTFTYIRPPTLEIQDQWVDAYLEVGFGCPKLACKILDWEITKQVGGFRTIAKAIPLGRI